MIWKAKGALVDKLRHHNSKYVYNTLLQYMTELPTRLRLSRERANTECRAYSAAFLRSHHSDCPYSSATLNYSSCSATITHHMPLNWPKSPVPTTGGWHNRLSAVGYRQPSPQNTASEPAPKAQNLVKKATGALTHIACWPYLD